MPEELTVDPDSIAWLRLNGRALDSLARVDGTAMPKGYERFLPSQPIRWRLLVAAYRSYSRAWKRSGNDDDTSAEARARLRRELGFRYDSRCWNCHDPLSDAPGDNDGRCDTCAWLRCVLCGACKVLGSHANPTAEWHLVP
jgi:hypothetical protein